jgi:hypothetical protein
MRSSLSFRLAALAVAASSLVLPGCVKAQVAVGLNKDGSGTITETATLDMSKLGEIMAMFEGMGGGGEGGDGGLQSQIDDETNPEKVKEKLKGKKGVELISATRTEDKEKKTQTSEKKIKFQTLEDYFRSGDEKSAVVRLEQLPDGAWKFTRQMVRKGIDDQGEMPAEAAGMMEMVKGMLQPYMENMEMGATMTLPGTIVETNGTKSADGTSVTWKYTFDGLFGKDVLKQVVVFKGEGLTLKPFHIKIDDEANATDVTAGSDAPAPAPAPVEPK